jgi:phage N-6-adenine-methyltransferase
MFSSKSDNWPTPQDLFDTLDAEFHFDLDPCASPANAKCARYFTVTNDGLDQEWTGRVFMNPPYGATIGQWMRKAHESARAGTAELVVCLVPARTDTRWWHDFATEGEIRFLRGRLRFGDGKYPAPFPSALVVFRDAESVTKALLDEAA